MVTIGTTAERADGRASIAAAEQAHCRHDEVHSICKGVLFSFSWNEVRFLHKQLRVGTTMTFQCTLFLFFSLLLLSWAWKIRNARKEMCINAKKSLIGATIAVASRIVQVVLMEPQPALAVHFPSSSSSSTFLVSRNLPEETGASRGNQGQISSLIPIIKMQKALEKAILAANDNNIEEIKSNLDPIPSEEKKFKRIFDEYSQGISYKQEYLDKNAFLV